MAAAGAALRIVAWNVDGLERRLQHLPAIAGELGDPDVLCLQEVRIRASDEAAIARMREALPGYTCAWSLNRDARNVRFRGGRAHGVATFVRTSLRATHETLPWDREGRVVVTRVKRVVVVNVYAPNGTDRPYVHPDTGAPAGTRFDFKRAFQRLVAERMGVDEDRVVGIGDWNVTPARIDTHPRLRTEEPHATARAELAAIAAELGLVDVFRAMHPDARAYTWFARHGRGLDAARVDYALVASALVPRVVAADVLPLRDESDHAPIALVLRPPTR